MKTVFIIGIFLLVFQSAGYSQEKSDKYKIRQDTVSVDSVEYELLVFDHGFESWMATKPSKNFYSKEFYEQKNWLYVMEWNRRFNSSSRSYLYDSYIDYNPWTDYGLDLNYKLYYYFKYFEETNHVSLINQVR